jgi:hypothetical protein
VKVEKVN